MPRRSSPESSRSAPDAGSASRTVHIVYEREEWHVRSEDGEVGGIFVSHDAALRFAEREFGRGQERSIVDDAATLLTPVLLKWGLARPARP